MLANLAVPTHSVLNYPRVDGCVAFKAFWERTRLLEFLKLITWVAATALIGLACYKSSFLALAFWSFALSIIGGLFFLFSKIIFPFLSKNNLYQECHFQDIHYAVVAKHHWQLKLLLNDAKTDLSLNVNPLNIKCNKQTVLGVAIWNRNAIAVQLILKVERAKKMLLEAEETVKPKWESKIVLAVIREEVFIKMTPLQVAVSIADGPIMTILLENGAQVEGLSEFIQTIPEYKKRAVLFTIQQCYLRQLSFWKMLPQLKSITVEYLYPLPQ